MKRITAVLGALVLVVMTLAGCGSGGDSASGPTLTLVTWGGTTADGIRQSIADPFTKETGIATNVTEPVDYGKYTAQIEQNQVTWDWVDLEAFFIIAHRDWWAPTDTEAVKLDPADVIKLPGGQGTGVEGLIPAGSYSFAISYRTEENKPHPTTWAEFFDTAKFPGKRAIYNSPYGMLEVALLADGVPFDKLYPLDTARAERKLESIRGDLVFWNSGAELQQIMTSGEADYAFAWNNRIADIQKKGAPVALEWNQNLQDGGFNVTAKNGPSVAGRTPEESARALERLHDIEVLGPVGVAEQSITRWYTTEQLAADSTVAERVIAQMTALDPLAYTAAYRVLATTDLADDLHRISAPTLAITGEYDVGSPPHMTELIAARTGGGAVIIPGAKHSVLHDHASLIAKEILTHVHRDQR